MKRLLLLPLLLASLAVHADAGEEPGASLYQVEAALTDQDGRRHGLDVHRGHPVLITLFYASCPAACPLIIDTLRDTEKQLTAAERADLRVLMISVDPENDTPAALQALARQRRIDTARWTLSTADAETVRTIAALLDVQYRKLPDGGYNHSSVVTLLSPTGAILSRSTRLGTADTALVAKLRE